MTVSLYSHGATPSYWKAGLVNVVQGSRPLYTVLLNRGIQSDSFSHMTLLCTRAWPSEIDTRR